MLRLDQRNSRHEAPMNFTEIIFERRDRTAIITFNRPAVRNCIGPVTHRELISAWAAFRDDPELHVAVLTGAGEDAFCAGGDLTSVGELVPRPDEIPWHDAGNAPGLLGPSRSTDICKPIIAAVNGIAFAGGLEWAGSADMCSAEAATPAR